MPLREFEPGSIFNVYVYVHEQIGPDGEVLPSDVATWMRLLDNRHKGTFSNPIKRHANHGQG